MELSNAAVSPVRMSTGAMFASRIFPKWKHRVNLDISKMEKYVDPAIAFPILVLQYCVTQSRNV